MSSGSDSSRTSRVDYNAGSLDPVSSPEVLSTGEEQKVLNYLTPEALASAIPLPIPKVYSPPGVRTAPTAALVSSEPRLQDPVDEGDRAWAAANFQTSLVDDMTVWPFKPVGKLYMTFGSTNYQGSAWTIGESAIFTAG